jgi:hypothetical protein
MMANAQTHARRESHGCDFAARGSLASGIGVQSMSLWCVATGGRR